LFTKLAPPENTTQANAVLKGTIQEKPDNLYDSLDYSPTGELAVFSTVIAATGEEFIFEVVTKLIGPVGVMPFMPLYCPTTALFTTLFLSSENEQPFSV